MASPGAPTHYFVPKELMDVIYRTLQYYGNETAYMGKRVGGVVAGCPRAPAPLPHELVLTANYTLKRIDREILGRDV